MFIAKNEKGERVTHLEGNKNERYFCPCCDAEVRFKQGTVISSHFAHITKQECDEWYEMSEWHSSWQEMFPKETREIVLEKDGEKHRADIFIQSKHKNLIIEFQNSPISKTEIERRNAFYSQFGELLWVFNFSDKHIHEFSRRNIIEVKELNKKFNVRHFHWKWYTKSLPLPEEFSENNVDFCLEIPNRMSEENVRYEDSLFVFPLGVEFGDYNEFYCRNKDYLTGRLSFMDKLRAEFKMKTNRNDIRLALQPIKNRKPINKKSYITFGGIAFVREPL